MDIFGIGLGEMLFLLVLGMIVIGPDKLPEMARKAGKAVAVIKAQTDEMKSMISLETQTKPTTPAAPAQQPYQITSLYDGKYGTPFDKIAPIRIVNPDNEQLPQEATQVEIEPAAAPVDTVCEGKVS